MTRFRAATLAVAVATFGALACDSVTTRPADQLRLQACPSGTQNVNAPIVLTFTTPLLASSVTLSNVVVSDAGTGVTIPGAVALQSGANAVQFTPSAPLPFGHLLRIRVQNLLSAGTRSQIPVTLCAIFTTPPPITDTSWTSLPLVSGDVLDGVSMVGPDSGYVMNQSGVLFKGSSTGFTPVDHSPYLFQGFDVAFVSPTHGFAAWQNARTFDGWLLETKDGGVTFDSAAVTKGFIAFRLYFTASPDTAHLFGVVGGGNVATSNFYKWHPQSGTLTLFHAPNAGYPTDIDFAAGDTTKGAATTNGVKVGSFDMRGQVFTSSDGGATWNAVAGLTASSAIQTYLGVSVRKNGEIYVAGGSGFLARLTPSGGAYTVTPLLVNALANPDSTNPLALYFSDVQFAPDNDQVGWAIGAQQIQVVGGVPTYRGLIFMTRDGGRTWTREGVRGAANFAADFPRLNRLSVLSSTSAWAVGDGGLVIKFQPLSQ